MGKAFGALAAAAVLIQLAIYAGIAFVVYAVLSHFGII